MSPEGWALVLAVANTIDLAPGDAEDDRRLARVLLAAHVGKVIKLARGAAAGNVTSEKAGAIARSCANVSAIDPTNFATTRYGSLFALVLGMSGCAGPMLA